MIDSNIRYCDRAEEVPLSTEYLVKEYLGGRIEKPVEFIKSEIDTATREIESANYALAQLGLCWTAEKRHRKQQLKEKRLQSEGYIAFLKMWLNVRSHNDLAFELFSTDYPFLKL